MIDPTIVIVIVNCVLSSVQLVVSVLEKTKIRSGCLRRIGCCFCSMEPIEDSVNEDSI
jgi:hypothetical protein